MIPSSCYKTLKQKYQLNIQYFQQEQTRAIIGNNLEIPNQNDNSTSPSTLSEKSPSTGESRKKFNFKTAVNATRFANRISPKGQRKLPVERKTKKSATFKVKFVSKSKIKWETIQTFFRFIKMNWSTRMNIISSRIGWILFLYTGGKKPKMMQRMIVEQLDISR